MAELKDSSGLNNRGLRGMTYSRYGGNLITFGFETYMNGIYLLNYMCVIMYFYLWIF